MTKYPRILFFINGVAPSLDEQLAADQLAPCRVAFRNAKFVPDSGALEEADGVFGDATPKRYADAYPVAEEAIKAFVEKRDADHKAKSQQAEAARQAVADEKADKAEDAAEKADAKAKAATKEAKAKSGEAKDARKDAKDKAEAADAAKSADPADAAPTVDAAEKAQAAWTNNA